MLSDAPFSFAEENEQALERAGTAQQAVWPILVADDDEEVHRATVFALRTVDIDGRPLELIHAYSAAEAKAALQHRRDIAVIMLDVVMETHDAGLNLVGAIRQELGLRNTRIVLRTGQPGYAPELDVIRSFDINDYRTKSELTQTRLITTLTAAVRAYAQLEQIETSNRGLSEVARTSNLLFRIRSSREFARALLDRIGVLLKADVNGFVCVEPSGADITSDRTLQILHGAGRYGSAASGTLVESAVDADCHRTVRQAVAARTLVFAQRHFVGWIGSGTRAAAVCFLHERPLEDIEKRLLEVFAANMAVCFENVDLFERLDFFAFFDPLTRLPNRTRFLADVDQHLLSGYGNQYCLAIADVMRFSDINDALGHRCGDTLLIGVGKRLRAALGPGVVLARIASDAFGIYGPEGAIDGAAIARAFEAPFFVHGHALNAQMRLGVVRVAESKGVAVELLRNANLALNEARHRGGNSVALFTRSMAEEVQDRVTLLHGLRAAIDFKRGLAVHYQPQVNARTGEVVGMEALLRWRNDYGEMVPPDRFIPLAERTGLINELGMWVLEVSLEKLSALHAKGQQKLAMSVNLSPVQLRTEDFAERVRRVLALCDVPPSSVILEVTESVGLEDHARVSAHLSALRAMGIRLAIDDFGTGFSSLSQLTRMPADILKIDRSFVAALEQGAQERAVATTVVMLAESRDLGVIAEGVETMAQVSQLLEMGCEQMQGYHFARPMSSEQFDLWLRERSH